MVLARTSPNSTVCIRVTGLCDLLFNIFMWYLTYCTSISQTRQHSGNTSHPPLSLQQNARARSHLSLPTECETLKYTRNTAGDGPSFEAK